MGPEAIFDGAEDAALPLWTVPCLERSVAGLGPTWVHGYTGADVAAWRRLARCVAAGVPECLAANGKEPTPHALQFAQAVTVCRRGPGAAERTFRVEHGGEAQAWAAFRGLPGSFVETVCRESDWLTMSLYQRAERRPGAQAGAARDLSEMLRDPEFWTALDHLSRRMCGVAIAENGEPLGEVLALLEHDLEVRGALMGAVGALGGMA